VTGVLIIIKDFFPLVRKMLSTTFDLEQHDFMNFWLKI